MEQNAPFCVLLKKKISDPPPPPPPPPPPTAFSLSRVGMYVSYQHFQIKKHYMYAGSAYPIPLASCCAIYVKKRNDLKQKI